VKKLLALFLCFSLVGVMSVGLTGCDKGKTDAQKKLEKDKIDKADAAKAEAAKEKADNKDKDAKDKDAKDKTADKDKDAKDKDAKDKGTKDKDAKAEVTIIGHEGKVALDKKGKKNVTVELTNPAPADLTLKAWAKGVDAKVLTGTGTIKEGAKSGDVTITTVDAPDTIIEITVDVAATDKSKAASTKLKVAIK
jgi:hypothetical protein